MAIDTNIQQFDPNGCIIADTWPKPSSYGYASPNVYMTTTGDPSSAPIGANTTEVEATWTSGCSIPDSNEAGFGIVFDLYIADPGIGAWVPGSAGITELSNAGGQLFPGISANGVLTSTSVKWNTSATSGFTELPHACLLLRVYPSTATGATGDLQPYVTSDQHYAQRNISVGATDGSGKFQLPLRNGIVFRDPLVTSIHAIPVPAPARLTLDAIRPSLELTRGFKQIATDRLPIPRLDVTAFDSPHKVLLQRPENFRLIQDVEATVAKAGGTSARVALPPNFFSKFVFSVDLSATAAGDACIYQVTQTTITGEPYGGVIIGVVRV